MLLSLLDRSSHEADHRAAARSSVGECSGARRTTYGVGCSLLAGGDDLTADVVRPSHVDGDAH